MSIVNTELHIRITTKEKQQIYKSAKCLNISVKEFILNSAYNNVISSITINNIDSINNQLDKDGEMINNIAKGLNSLLRQEKTDVDLLSHLIQTFEQFDSRELLNQSNTIVNSPKDFIISK